MAFTHIKKVDIESFIEARIRIQIRSQTSGSGSAILLKGTAVISSLRFSQCL
jgi:hypothetical protein